MNPDLRTKFVSAGRLILDATNGLVSPLDRLFGSGGADDNGMAGRCLFILGAPRSGTTLTYQVITQQFNVAYFTGAMNYFYGMPNLLARLLRRPHLRPPEVFESYYGKIPGAFAPAESGNFWFRWFPRDGVDGNLLTAERFGERQRTQLRDALASMVRIYQRPMAFKCVYLTMVIPILARVLPQACFLYLKRDMLQNCQSLVLARRRLGLEHCWWSVRPPGYRTLLNEPLWKQAAEQILLTRSIIERDLRNSAPDRFLEIEYEVLCDDPLSVLAQLEQWLRPRGYEAYPDVRLPGRFPRAECWTLEHDEDTVRNYLEQSWQTKQS